MAKLENFQGENKKVIEIMSTDSQYYLLKRSGINTLKIRLPLNLYIGKLDSINNFARTELKKYIYDSNYMLFENELSFKYEFDKLKNYAENADKIRVWSSHLDCNDYCLLLFICNYFGDKKISVLFSEEYNWYATTCTCLSEKEIIELSKKEHILNKSEIEQYKKEWEKILLQNTELRFMINGVVQSVNINYFDKEILNRLGKLGQVYMYKLVGDLMANPIIPYFRYPDYIYVYLINRLIDDGKIEKEIKNNKVFISCSNKIYM